MGIGVRSNSQFSAWKEVNGGLVGFGRSQRSLKALMSWKRRGTAEDKRLFRLARKGEGARSLGQQEEVMVGAAVLEGGALYGSFTALTCTGTAAAAECSGTPGPGTKPAGSAARRGDPGCHGALPKPWRGGTAKW